MNVTGAPINIHSRTLPSGRRGRSNIRETETRFTLYVLPEGDYEFHTSGKFHHYPERAWINVTVTLRPGFAWWPAPNMRWQRDQVDRICKEYGFKRCAKVYQYDNWSSLYDVEKVR